MILTKRSKSFDPCPEFSGQAVCVDVTPPKTVQTAFGPKEQFRLVFEAERLRDDGSPYLVWSRAFTPSLNEKAAFAQFLRKWLGRPLTASEEAEFDTESLVGRAAEITVVHENGNDGTTYANIALIRSDRSPKPLVPSGRYTRVKDRDEKPRDAEFRRAESAPAEEKEDTATWRQTKIHVGKHKGLTLGDLDRAAVQSLIDRWLPTASAAPKKSADDKRLITGLEAAMAELAADAEDNIPMGNQPY
jgi:hypothetical protein